MTLNHSTKIENFGPQWFSAVMGTGAVAISMHLASKQFLPFLLASQMFLAITIAMFLLFIGPWVIRFFKYSEKVKKEWKHPVKGNFFPTMPISLIIIGIALDKIGPTLFSTSSIHTVNTLLFFIGSIGIFLFGWITLSIIFVNKKTDVKHANYGWFIPPVSHLIIPVLGLSLIKPYAGTLMADVLFTISMIALGVGLLLFLFVGSIVYHRYTYHELPVSRLAPTFLIGIAPTSIITVILVKFSGAIENVGIGIELSKILPELKIMSLMAWGFSIWWLVLSVILLLHYVKNKNHPFVFGWWAYTFPLGAFAISNGAIAHLIDFTIFGYVLQGINVVLLFVWIVVFFSTIKSVMNGKCFEEHE